MTPLEATKSAKEILEVLTSRSCETVMSCELLENQWKVYLEVVDKKGRITDFDVIALYQVDIDNKSGDVLGYKCHRRYRRGDAAGAAA